MLIANVSLYSQSEESSFSSYNDINIGLISLLTPVMQSSTQSITFINLQYSRGLTPYLSFYLEMFTQKGEVAYEKDDLKKIEGFGTTLIHSGVNWFPFTPDPGDGLFLKGGIGFASVFLETLGNNLTTSGACLFVGPGYRAVFADFFLVSAALTYNPFKVYITNPTRNDDLGGLDGSGLESFMPELSFGFRF